MPNELFIDLVETPRLHNIYSKGLSLIELQTGRRAKIKVSTAEQIKCAPLQFITYTDLNWRAHWDVKYFPHLIITNERRNTDGDD